MQNIELPQQNEFLDEIKELKFLKSDITQESGNENGNENGDERLNKNPYKEMIENQTGPLTHGNKEKPEISITFDDGYGPDNVRHILNTLEGSGIHATFFVLGNRIDKYPDLWKEAIDEGHQICCHTFSHIYLSNSSEVTNINSGLNKDINVNEWINNVKTLLGNEYFEKIKHESDEGFPYNIKSSLLLETEILMRESQIKNTLGEGYLQHLKQNYPFFRFPGGNGAKRAENIAVLKKLGYLSIGWSDDMRRYHKDESGKMIGKHLTLDEIKNLEIKNGDIPLFHFKKDDYEYIDAYIDNMKLRHMASYEVSHIVK